MADCNTTGRKSASQQPPAGRQQSVAPASTHPEPTGPMLYEHQDGRYAIAPRPDLADFTRGDPGWTRLGRISVVVPDARPEPDEDRGRFVYMNVPDLPVGPGLSEVADAICRRLNQVRGIASLLGSAPRALDSLREDAVEGAAWAAGDLIDQCSELVHEMLRMGREAEEDVQRLLGKEASHV